MKKVNRGISQMEQPEISVGLDLGDRLSHYCMHNGDGDAVETGRIQTAEADLQRHFQGEPAMSVPLGYSTHSPFIGRPQEQLGHQAIVVNSRKIRAITGSESKLRSTRSRPRRHVRCSTR